VSYIKNEVGVDQKEVCPTFRYVNEQYFNDCRYPGHSAIALRLSHAQKTDVGNFHCVNDNDINRTVKSPTQGDVHLITKVQLSMVSVSEAANIT